MTVRGREKTTSERGCSRTCGCEGRQRNDCRQCAQCRDMPRYNGRNKIKKLCVERTCLRHQKAGDATGRPRQSAVTLGIFCRRQEQAVAKAGRLAKEELQGLLPACPWEGRNCNRDEVRLDNGPRSGARQARGTPDS